VRGFATKCQQFENSENPAQDKAIGKVRAGASLGGKGRNGQTAQKQRCRGKQTEPKREVDLGRGKTMTIKKEPWKGHLKKVEKM